MREPDFERVRTALLRGVPDRVPLFELKIDAPVMSAFLGRPVETPEDVVAFQVAAGYDYARIRASYDIIYINRVRKEGEYTSYGNGKGTIDWANEHTGPIQTMADFERFDWLRAEDVDYSNIERAAKVLPDGMKIISSANGIWETVWMLMGFEPFCYATVEQPELVDALFDRVGELFLNIFRNEIEIDGVAAMMFTDDMAYVSGPMIDPAIFRRHVFPWAKKMGALCAERDMPFILHSCGNVSALLDDIVEAGFDALHPLEPKAIDAVKVKEQYGDRLALLGNVSLDQLARATPDEVRRLTRERIDLLGPGGYGVGSSNSVPPWVPLENFRAMIEVALEA